MQFNGSIALIAAGLSSPLKFLQKRLHAFSHYIAVDGGLDILHALGICPDLIIGDFDSVHQEALSAYSQIPRLKFPRDKDHSDLELALDYALQVHTKGKPLHVFGAMGGRNDHALANLYLLSRYPNQVVFESDKELIFAAVGEVELPCHPGQSVSFLPLEQAGEIISSGLRWELNKACFNHSFFSLSNECLGNVVKLYIETGTLLCFLQKKVDE